VISREESAANKGGIGIFRSFSKYSYGWGERQRCKFINSSKHTAEIALRGVPQLRPFYRGCKTGGTSANIERLVLWAFTTKGGLLGATKDRWERALSRKLREIPQRGEQSAHQRLKEAH